MNDRTGPADPITVLRVHKSGTPPGRARFWLCPRSIARRLAADTAASGTGDDVTDLGPGALLFAQAADRKRDAYHDGGQTFLVPVGVSTDDGLKWRRWYPPAPIEPVPGSPGAAAARN